MQFSWAGAYIGVNAGAVLDRNEPGQLNLTSPGFVFSDPTGAFAGFRVNFVGFPGGFSSVPYAQSRSGGAFIGGGQIGYNLQSGNIVYGVEADFQVMRNRDTLSGIVSGIHPRPAADRQHHPHTFAAYFDRPPVAGNVPRPLRLCMGPPAGLRDRRSCGDQPQDRRQLHLPDPPRSGAGPVPGRAPAEFQRRRRRLQPGVLRRDLRRRRRVRLLEQLEPRRRISLRGFRQAQRHARHRAGRRRAPARDAGHNAHLALLAAGHRAAELSLRRGRDGDQVGRAPGSPGSNWSGCYAGGYAGVAWGRGPVDTFDPSTNGQQVFGPPPLLQTTFYNSSAGEFANPAPYSYNFTPAAWAAGRSAVTGSLPRPGSCGASRPRPASCA